MYRSLKVHYHSSVRNVISPFLLQVIIRNQTYKNEFKRLNNTPSKNTIVNTNEDNDNSEPIVDFSLVYGTTPNRVVYFDVYEKNDEENEVEEPNDYLQDEEPYIDFSLQYDCYETFSYNTENILVLNRKPKNVSLLETSQRTLSQTETLTEPQSSKKRRIFLEPRVVLADPNKGVRFSFELPYIEVDETEEETILNTELEENENIWGNYFYNCTNEVEFLTREQKI